MDNNKVTLPRDVAEAIEYFREKGHTDAYIVSRSVVGGVGGHEISLVNFDKDALMSALVNSCTIEQTPEEKVREYFGNAKNEYTHLTPHYDADECDIEIAMRYKYSLGKAVAIKKTLDLLGIKIEGVNA